jgi:hypothetical protein
MEHRPQDKRAFFVWVLPLAWGVSSLAQSRFPGDEHGFYVVSALPAAWAALFLLLGRIPKETIPICVLLAGAPVMAGIGWGMDRLRIRKILWGGLYLIGAGAVLCLVLGSFPSIERAVGKNGSLWANLLLASNMGLYLSVVLSVVATCIARVVTAWRAAWKQTRQGVRGPDSLRPA